MSTLEQSFQNPPAEFRMIPGYGAQWGDAALDKVKSLGFGGVVYHLPHQGYLTDPAQWERFENIVNEAHEKGLQVWIYDEDGFPSGPGGGQVLQQYPEGEAIGLYYSFAFIERAGRAQFKMPWGKPVYVRAAPVRNGQVELANAIDISGSVKADNLNWGPHDMCLDWGTSDRDTWIVMVFSERVLYERTFADHAAIKPPYHMINLMDEKAVKFFLEVTHQRYADHSSKYFGNTIPAFFTDEPSLMNYQDNKMPTTAVPWHPQFAKWFQEKYGYDIMYYLPAFYHDCGPMTKKVRCDYFDLVTDKVENSYHKQIADWCAAHGVDSSGHLLLEERIYWHALFQGDFMRCIRHMHRPGIDVLSSKSELTRPHENLMGGALLLGAKFCSSVKHHYGRERSFSETSGYQQFMRRMTFDYLDVQATLSWQYVLGIDTIISFYGRGPFAEEKWPDINAYAGRLGLMLTGGSHICDIAVFYPIKSQWANFVRQKNELDAGDQALRCALDDEYVELSMDLLEHQRDFDYLHEELLLSAEIKDGRLLIVAQAALPAKVGQAASLSTSASSPAKVGQAASLSAPVESYSVLILPPMDTENPAVLEKAIQFAQSGGTVITVGRLPEHSADGDDARMKSAVEKLLALDAVNGRYAETRPAMLEALEAMAPRDFEATPATKKLLYLHRRKDNQEIFFVFNNSREPYIGEIAFGAKGKTQTWSPVNGAIRDCSSKSANGKTIVPISLTAYEGTLVVFS